jgi:hypothetical protein
MAEIINETPVEPTIAPEPVKMEAKRIEKSKSVEELVKEVIVGLHGSGRERMLSLGDDYEAVQHEVNQLIKKGEI